MSPVSSEITAFSGFSVAGPAGHRQRGRVVITAAGSSAYVNIERYPKCGISVFVEGGNLMQARSIAQGNTVLVASTARNNDRDGTETRQQRGNYSEIKR